MPKYFKSLLAFIFIFFLIPKELVQAKNNSIQSIEIEVELHSDASATIREKRIMESHKDSEVYIELSNLGPSELLSFEVEGFKEKNPWDIDASFEEKAYSYGVLEKDSAYELAWGISEYGQQSYDLQYRLSNVVRELTDGQALFWNFDSFLSLPTKRMQLTIESEAFPLADKLIDSYAFGFEGPVEIKKNGSFEWTGYELDESNDIIVLLQFPKETFQSEALVDQTLDEQKELALTGSSYNEAEDLPRIVKGLIALSLITTLGLGAGGVAYAIKINKVKKENKHFNPSAFKQERIKSVSKKAPRLQADKEYYAWFIHQLAPTAGSYSDYFFYYLTLWEKEGLIEIQSKDKESRVGKEEKVSLIIKDFVPENAHKPLDFDEYLELFELEESRLDELIWAMLLELADTEGQVFAKDVEKWAKKHAKSIDKMVRLLQEGSLNWLENEDYLNIFPVDVWGATIEIKQLTKKGEKVALEMVAYQNFIKEIKEAKLTELKDWEELMQWAILFALADSVIEQLKDFDPVRWTELQEIYPHYYGHYYAYHHFYRHTNQGLAAAGYSASGGYSSAAGGMGAAGGGGGGTR